MNKLLIAITVISSCQVCAHISDSVKQKIQQDDIQMMISEGFNPNGGITIVDDLKPEVPLWVNKEWHSQKIEQDKNGYVKKFSYRANELIEFSKNVQLKYDLSAVTPSPDSSVLRKTLDEITFAYAINPVPDRLSSKIYGFAAGNTYQKGWTGFVEFFESSLGTCVFTENNVTITHQAAKVERTSVKYLVNDKISTLNVIGDEQSGYLYKVDWFDNSHFRTLECATKNYNVATTGDVISMSNEIDLK